MKDFSFQGKVYLGERLAGGKPGKLRWVGDAPVCTVELATESEERRESYSGNRLTSAQLQTSKDANITLTLNYFSAENVALGLYGQVNTVVGGSVTGEELPSGLVNGDTVALARGNVSNLVITDSAGTPATVPSANYSLDSADGGILRILDVGTFVQPFKAAYDYAAQVDVAMFTEQAPERFLLLDGVNTIDNLPVRVELYRTKFNPASSVPMINEGFGQLELTGVALYDSDAALDAALGGFGRIRTKQAA